MNIFIKKQSPEAHTFDASGDCMQSYSYYFIDVVIPISSLFPLVKIFFATF